MAADRKLLKRAAALTAAAFSVVACQPQNATDMGAATPSLVVTGQEATQDTGCNLSVDASWIDQETPLRRYTSEAHTLGATCDTAVVVLTIRAREGSPVFVWAGAVRDIFGLKDAADPAAMKAALAEWIDQSHSLYPASDKLPEWPAGAEAPAAGEFPFYPDTWIDRPYWESLRSASRDVFCFPQGMESMLCAALHDGVLETIGVQTFPG